MQGIYIHIPFCVSKCSYCSFVSYAGRQNLITPYIKALLKEASLYKKTISPGTLYIGGGTPSLLSCVQMKTLCTGIQNIFGPVKSFKEATFECNPESLTPAKVKLLKELGFTRLSLGMQTTSDKHLKLIERAHNSKQFLKAYKTVRKYFDNVNVDLIAALPKQSFEDFKKAVTGTVALKPQHISIYGLEIEEGTKIYKAGYKNDDDLCRQMLEFAASYLAGHGYTQYEISNYTQKDRESLHNINYWRNGQYLGLGASAVSYIKGVRRTNTPDVDFYIKQLNRGKRPVVYKEALKGKAKAGEKIILGLRMLSGINVTPVIRSFFAADFEKLQKQGLLIKSKNNIRLSEEGKYLANEAFRHFVEPF
jgi:oxygen-independent coproporphyrinogen-3 oxidase